MFLKLKLTELETIVTISPESGKDTLNDFYTEINKLLHSLPTPTWIIQGTGDRVTLNIYGLSNLNKKIKKLVFRQLDIKHCSNSINCTSDLRRLQKLQLERCSGYDIVDLRSRLRLKNGDKTTTKAKTDGKTIFCILQEDEAWISTKRYASGTNTSTYNHDDHNLLRCLLSQLHKSSCYIVSPPEAIEVDLKRIALSKDVEVLIFDGVKILLPQKVPVRPKGVLSRPSVWLKNIISPLRHLKKLGFTETCAFGEHEKDKEYFYTWLDVEHVQSPILGARSKTEILAFRLKES